MLNFDPLQAFLFKCLGAAIILGAIGIAIKSNKGNVSQALSVGAGNLIAIIVAALGVLVMASQTDIGQRFLRTVGLA